MNSELFINLLQIKRTHLHKKSKYSIATLFMVKTHNTNIDYTNFTSFAITMKTIAILGGLKWFGARVAQQIKENQNIKILCTRTSSENITAVGTADIVIISVPICHTEKTIKEIWPKINKNAIVIDVTSLKEKPVQWMKKYLPKTCTVIPTHPMFGPSLASVMWQVVVLTPDEKTKKTVIYKLIKEMLIKKWAHVIQATPQKHDEVMAIIQWLTHMTLFIMWETMRRMKIDVDFSEQFVSPIYKIMTSSVMRYMWHNLWLYADIQLNNPHIPKVHKTFMTVSKQFTDILKNTRNKEASKQSFLSVFEKTKDFFGDNTKKGQQHTDKIIFLLAKQQEILVAKKWKHITCENIYTKNKRSWILSWYTEKQATLDHKTHIDLNQRIVLS